LAEFVDTTGGNGVSRIKPLSRERYRVKVLRQRV